jgi:hypothetical protein
MNFPVFWLLIPSEDQAKILRVAGDVVTSFSVQSDVETSLAKAIANVFWGGTGI